MVSLRLAIHFNIIEPTSNLEGFFPFFSYGSEKTALFDETGEDYYDDRDDNDENNDDEEEEEEETEMLFDEESIKLEWHHKSGG